jgi:hypothetical protein
MILFGSNLDKLFAGVILSELVDEMVDICLLADER